MEPAVLIWTFTRGAERIVLAREHTADGYVLTVTENGRVQSRVIAPLDALVAFERNTETLLLDAGWTPADFSPERRTGIERRSAVRVDADRRRLWPHGMALVEPPRR